MVDCHNCRHSDFNLRQELVCQKHSQGGSSSVSQAFQSDLMCGGGMDFELANEEKGVHSEFLAMLNLKRGDLLQNIKTREIWRVNSAFGDGVVVADSDNEIQVLTSLNGWKIRKETPPS